MGVSQAESDLAILQVKYKKLQARNRRLHAALISIACIGGGHDPETDGIYKDAGPEFDNPGDANKARRALRRN